MHFILIIAADGRNQVDNQKEDRDDIEEAVEHHECELKAHLTACYKLTTVTLTIRKGRNICGFWKRAAMITNM